MSKDKKIIKAVTKGNDELVMKAFRKTNGEHGKKLKTFRIYQHTQFWVEAENEKKASDKARDILTKMSDKFVYFDYDFEIEEE